MQDAWVVDQNTVGQFEEIAYEKPTSANITYSDLTTSKGGTSGGWQGAGGSAFSKCTGTGGSTWSVTATSANNRATYTASDNCPALIPNFKFIGSSNGS